MSETAIPLGEADALRARLRDGRLSVVNLTEAVLERAQDSNDRLKAFVAIDREGALARAADLDREGFREDLPLWGLPLAHKDLFARADRQPGCGVETEIADAHLPPSPALLATQEAGAVDLGPLSLAEFALGTTGTNAVFGDVRNPWDLERCTGASSSGSAAAVAAGLAVASLGTDTGASVRVPASFCGIVGLKPTAGAIDNTGVFPLAWSLDAVSPMARTLKDCALLFAVVAEPAARAMIEAAGRPDRLRIGMPDRYYGEDADPQVAAAWSAAARTLERAGHEVVPTPVVETAAIRSLIRAIMRTEAAAVHRGAMATHPHRYAMAVRKFISSGEGIAAVDYVDALRLRASLLQDALRTTFSRVDLILTPTAPVLPPRYRDIADPSNPAQWRVVTKLAHCAQPASYLGLPALSVPYDLSSEGLPIGLQLIGPPFSERRLFQAARPLEDHWRSLGAAPPPLS